MYKKNDLRERRLASGMTLKDLAEKTGIDHRYLIQLEKGLRKGTPNKWIKISEVLEVPLMTFFTDEIEESKAFYSCFG